MPNKPLADKRQCRYCKQREPVVKIKYVKGLPVGECQACNRSRQRNTLLRRNFSNGFYKAMPALASQNTQTLERLMPGAYALLLSTTKERIGYAVINSGMVYVNTWERDYLFHRRLWDIGIFIANIGLFIDPKPIELIGEDDKPLSLEAVGKGMAITEAADAMIWFDKALRERAIETIKAELRQNIDL